MCAAFRITDIEWYYSRAYISKNRNISSQVNVFILEAVKFFT